MDTGELLRMCWCQLLATLLLGSGAVTIGSAQENHVEGAAVALGCSSFLSTSRFLA